ncbi:MAG: AAA family ATPase [Chitinispirillales bacterium]|nr:AAA family ATPase [Chitinispirillales bacterium]
MDKKIRYINLRKLMYLIEYLGFTQSEMNATLAHYGLESKTQIIREWYDSYMFGNKEVYNLWSVIRVVKSWLNDINELPKPYLVNTSGNDIVQKLINKAGGKTKTELETLMAGGTISEIVNENITYNDIEKDTDNLWNILFFKEALRQIGKICKQEN